MSSLASDVTDRVTRTSVSCSSVPDVALDSVGLDGQGRINRRRVARALATTAVATDGGEDGDRHADGRRIDALGTAFDSATAPNAKTAVNDLVTQLQSLSTQHSADAGEPGLDPGRSRRLACSGGQRHRQSSQRGEEHRGDAQGLEARTASSRRPSRARRRARSSRTRSDQPTHAARVQRKDSPMAEDTPLLDTLALMTAASVEACNLEDRELMLARIAALAAVGRAACLVPRQRRHRGRCRHHARRRPGCAHRRRADRGHGSGA